MEPIETQVIPMENLKLYRPNLIHDSHITHIAHPY